MGGKIAFLIFGLFPLAAWGREYFTAAVLEHRPRDDGLTTPRDVIFSNLKFYEKAAKLAAKKGADIIVFNEFGIFPYRKSRRVLRQFAEHVPDPHVTLYNPCTDGGEDVPVLSTLSCMARRNNLYLVADLVDVQPCYGTCDAQVQACSRTCPEDGEFLYNTAVAFDRKGNVVARYHKMHPYFEVLDTPEDPEHSTFDTEFGRVGLFVCFDSVWEDSLLLVRDHGVDTVAFPTFWFDDILPLNGVEWQQGWAIAHGVNFLASNTQTPGNGSLGSGIYSRDLGALAYSYEPDGESKLVMARVPTSLPEDGTEFSAESSVTVIQEDATLSKEETGDAFPIHSLEDQVGPVTDLYTQYRVYSSQMENYTLERLEKDNGTLRVCQNGFCCLLEYESDMHHHEDYYFGAFSGLNNVRGYFRWCEESCLLVRCDPFEGRPCASQPSRATTGFARVKISAEFTAERVYPAVTLDKFRLASIYDWDFDHGESSAVLEFEPLNEEEPLLKAGLYGRCYSKDEPFVPFFRP